MKNSELPLLGPWRAIATEPGTFGSLYSSLRSGSGESRNLRLVDLWRLVSKHTILQSSHNDTY